MKDDHKFTNASRKDMEDGKSIKAMGRCRHYGPDRVFYHEARLEWCTDSVYTRLFTRWVFGAFLFNDDRTK